MYALPPLGRAGTVPGSSFAEKREPTRKRNHLLEDRCPGATAGLVLVVRRMMAKRPWTASRRQATWRRPWRLCRAPRQCCPPQDYSRLARKPDCVYRSETAITALLTVAGAGVTVALLLLALCLSPWPDWGNRPAGNGKDGLPQQPIDPDVLSVAQDGTGQYRTIGEALEQVRPGQTIRVLDGGTYEEALEIKDPDRHASITLEAVQKATIRPPPFARIGLTLRGYRTSRCGAFASSSERGMPDGCAPSGEDVRVRSWRTWNSHRPA